MFEQIIEKAVELFKEHVYDDDEQLLSSTYAWDWAVDQVILTDEDALQLTGEIIRDPKLSSKMDWHGESDTFAGMVRVALYGNDEFGQMVADRIENYEQTYAERKALTETRAASL